MLKGLLSQKSDNNSKVVVGVCNRLESMVDLNISTRNMMFEGLSTEGLTLGEEYWTFHPHEGLSYLLYSNMRTLSMKDVKFHASKK